jgi:hypothetical protein
MGRSRFDTFCPFCDERVTIYVWSMSGGGKKCPGCGSLFVRGECWPSEAGLAIEQGEAPRPERAMTSTGRSPLSGRSGEPVKADGLPGGGEVVAVPVAVLSLAHGALIACYGLMPGDLVAAIDAIATARGLGIVHLTDEDRQSRVEAAINEAVSKCPDDLGHVVKLGAGRPL